MTQQLNGDKNEKFCKNCGSIGTLMKASYPLTSKEKQHPDLQLLNKMGERCNSCQKWIFRNILL